MTGPFGLGEGARSSESGMRSRSITDSSGTREDARPARLETGVRELTGARSLKQAEFFLSRKGNSEVKDDKP